MTKYNGFTTLALVKNIQRVSLQLLDAEQKKEIPSTKLSRIHSELAEMRKEAIPRLKALDRMDSQNFFCAGYHVQYHLPQQENSIDEWDPVPPDKHGVVTGHDGNLCYVKFEDEEFVAKVEPQYLKIKFIR